MSCLVFSRLFTLCLNTHKTSIKKKKEKYRTKKDYVKCPGLGRGVVLGCLLFVFVGFLEVLCISLEKCEKPRENQQKRDSVSCPDLRGHNMLLLNCLKLFFGYFAVSGLFARASVIKCAGVVHIQALVQFARDGFLWCDSFLITFFLTLVRTIQVELDKYIK